MTVHTPHPTRRSFLKGTGALSLALLATGGAAVLPSAAEAQQLTETQVTA